MTTPKAAERSIAGASTPSARDLPRIIQGGMGVAISGWRLAREVCRLGHLGVVSGVGIDGVLCARLNDGDPDGMMRAALAAFPFDDVAQPVRERWFRAGGLRPGQAYDRAPMWTATPSPERARLGVLGGFCEVWLAKRGHDRPVGINLLEKTQLANLPVLYGALLAGVDVVIVGAGIPLRFPGVIDALCRHADVSYPLDLDGPSRQEHHVGLAPRQLFGARARALGALRRPCFLPIVSSNALAGALIRRADGAVDGLIVEAPVAGGHNAPPRGRQDLGVSGEPVYTERDVVDLHTLAALGLPFWLAGGFGSAAGLTRALEAGAHGIQVGTAFAFCDESGMHAATRQRVIDSVLDGRGLVRTDALASPTRFPFKIADLEGSVARPERLAERERVCDLGVLRHVHERDDGTLGYRCPAEPPRAYARKGGAVADTEGKVCLCNGLLATAGHAQRRRDGYVEPPLVTAGDALTSLGDFVPAGGRSYRAADVIDALQPAR